jgi:hypothetical protein
MIMKRLIVISVIFALVAGAAFAEINVGGGVYGKVNVLQGTSEKFWDDGDVLSAGNKDAIRASGGMGRIRLEASGQNDDETFGGWLRFETAGYGGGVSGYGLAWWKPIQQFKFQVGSNGGDGHFGVSEFVRYGFYAGAADIGVVNESWAFSSSFYGGFSAGGAILTITPIEPLVINIGIPFFEGGRAEGIFKQTNAQVAFNIDGIGSLAVTYAGGYEGDSNTAGYSLDADGNQVPKTGNLTRTWKVKVPTTGTGAFPVPILAPPAGSAANALDIYKFTTPYEYDIAATGANGASKIYASFDLTAIENLGVNIGIGFTLPRKYENEVVDNTGGASGKEWVSTTTDAYKYNTPLAVGLGVSFDAGAFGIKARVQGEFAEKFTWERTYKDAGSPGVAARSVSISRELKGPFVLIGDILPSFAINDSMKVFLSAGLTFTGGYDVLAVEENPLYDPPNSPATTEQYIEKNVARDSVVGWHINPYFSKSSGPGTFYAGFRLASGSKYIESFNLVTGEPNEKTIINWSVPVGVMFSF